MLTLLLLIPSLFAFNTEQSQKAFYSTVLIQLPNKSHCTGVIVSEKHVLTAAHCVNEKGYFRDALVHLHILDKSKSNKEYVTDPIQKIQLHPLWNSKTTETDAVLLELTRPIPQKLNQARIHFDFNKNENEKLKNQALLMGYGISAKAKVDPKEYEKEIEYPKIRGKLFNLKSAQDNKSHLLTLDNRTAQACVGDSGGPLLALTESGEFRLVGIAVSVQLTAWKRFWERLMIENNFRDPNHIQFCTSQASFLKLESFKNWLLKTIQ